MIVVKVAGGHLSKTRTLEKQKKAATKHETVTPT